MTTPNGIIDIRFEVLRFVEVAKQTTGKKESNLQLTFHLGCNTLRRVYLKTSPRVLHTMPTTFR